MAGHSHSANIKHRKDRQDSARSQLFLKVRKKIENIIREEHEVNEKSLSLSSLSGYFQVLYGLKINLRGANKNLEEYLLTSLPGEIKEKIIYDEKKRELASPDKEAIVKIKKIIAENKLELVIEQERN